jgi:hypothetical protein
MMAIGDLDTGDNEWLMEGMVTWTDAETKLRR